jgi:nanoRNase/pAp phosphatase (c-di-AMP/oligoRNAs hydrolase)
VQDRDLWRFELDGTKDYFAALTSRPYTFEAWDEISRLPIHEVHAEGRAINRYRDQLIEQAVALSAWAHVAGWLMPVTNCPYAYASDVAGELAKTNEGDGVAAYYFDDRKKNIRSWGLRSTPNGLDVAALAQTMGGGGHKHAAGFRTHLPIDEQ